MSIQGLLKRLLKSAIELVLAGHALLLFYWIFFQSRFWIISGFFCGTPLMKHSETHYWGYTFLFLKPLIVRHSYYPKIFEMTNYYDIPKDQIVLPVGFFQIILVVFILINLLIAVWAVYKVFSRPVGKCFLLDNYIESE